MLSNNQRDPSPIAQMLGVMGFGSWNLVFVINQTPPPQNLRPGWPRKGQPTQPFCLQGWWAQSSISERGPQLADGRGRAGQLFLVSVPHGDICRLLCPAYPAPLFSFHFLATGLQRLFCQSDDAVTRTPVVKL